MWFLLLIFLTHFADGSTQNLQAPNLTNQTIKAKDLIGTIVHLEVVFQGDTQDEKISIGMGFALEKSSTAYIVSALHNFPQLLYIPKDKFKGFVVTNKKGETFTAEVSNFSFLSDLALLKIEGYKGPFLELADIEYTSPAYILLVPHKGRSSFKKGLQKIELTEFSSLGARRVVAVRDDSLNPTNLRGYSGIPVFNSNGNVLGALLGGDEIGHTHFIRYDFIRELLETTEDINKASAENNTNPYERLKSMLERERDKVADLANNRNVEAQYAMAETFYWLIEPMKPVDSSLKSLWLNAYEDAAQNRSTEALITLGLIYIYGKRGVARDLEKGEALLRKAAKQNEGNLYIESILAGALVTIARFTKPLDEKKADQKLQEGVKRFVQLAPSLAGEGAEVGEGEYKPAQAFAVNLVREMFGWNKGGRRCQDSLSNVPIPKTGISSIHTQ